MVEEFIKELESKTVEVEIPDFEKIKREIIDSWIKKAHEDGKRIIEEKLKEAEQEVKKIKEKIEEIKRKFEEKYNEIIEKIKNQITA